MKHIFLSNSSILVRAIMIFISIVLILTGCAAPPTKTPAARPIVRAFPKPRLAALSFETARVPQLIDGNPTLAFGLYRRLFDREANLVYAPRSLSISLAMTFASGRGQTETQMVDAFGVADFSGIDDSRELFIDDVYHQAFISVDEAGTEAAASSAIEISRKGEPTAETFFIADHPFIFLIRDVDSGAVLLLGHVLNPDL